MTTTHTHGVPNTEHATTTEHAYREEMSARIARRNLISAGASVSLLAFDPTRDMYVFDVL